MKPPESKLFCTFIYRPLRGAGTCWFGSPGSASPSPGASTLSASFAGWLNGFFQPTTENAKKAHHIDTCLKYSTALSAVLGPVATALGSVFVDP